jgi:hypothetical protein
LREGIHGIFTKVDKKLPLVYSAETGFARSAPVQQEINVITIGTMAIMERLIL